MLYAEIVLVGHVQGVYCRSFVQSVAQGMNIAGTVRNLSDGSVRIECECSDENHFGEFLEKIKNGNGLMEVEKAEIKTKREIAKRAFADFEIERG